MQRKDREIFLNQKSKVLWLTGLSGLGKSTIAVGLEKKLFKNGFSPKCWMEIIFERALIII